MLQLEYTVVGNFDPDECRGQVELQLPSGASAPTLLQVKHAFPFEGDFHFRFQWYPTGAEDFVWLDVVDDAQVVPMTNAGTVAVQALSLEDVAQDHDDDHVQAEVPQPSRRLLASWEEVSGADLAAEAAAAATSAAAAAEESRGARAAGRPVRARCGLRPASTAPLTFVYSRWMPRRQIPMHRPAAARMWE